LNKQLGIPTDKIVRYNGLSFDQLLTKLKEVNGGPFDFTFDLYGGKDHQIQHSILTSFVINELGEAKNLSIAALKLDGHVVSIVEEYGGELKCF
jgi:hypothetical protein